MAEKVFHLIYMSECVLPTNKVDYANAIEQLLETSRDWNKDHEITGALLFSGGYSAQVLEGPPPAIKALIGQIICDPRHRNLKLVDRGLVSTRLFADWSMAYTRGNQQFDLSMMDVIDLPHASQAGAILEMLRHIITPDEVMASN